MEKENTADKLLNIVGNNNLELLRLVVNDLKLKPDVKNKEGKSLMHIAAEKGHDLMIYMLAEMGL